MAGSIILREAIDGETRCQGPVVIGECEGSPVDAYAVDSAQPDDVNPSKAATDSARYTVLRFTKCIIRTSCNELNGAGNVLFQGRRR